MHENESTQSPVTVDGADEVWKSILDALLQAFDCARDVEESPWSFAIEITSLRRRGVTETLLRWLAARGYAEHRLETTLPGDENRSFRRTGRFGFADSSCFVLTAAGAEFAGATLAGHDERRVTNGEAGDVAPSSPGGNGWPTSPAQIHSRHPAGAKDGSQNCTPVWDPLRRELRLGDQVVKRFKLPSANQETVLTVFHEEGWPVRIDDPLPPRPNHDPKMRLHNAIKGLNRHQKRRLIRFMGDGTGEGILWELIPSEE